MHRTIELAALPSTLQLCLQTADRCGGLVQVTPRGAFVPRMFHAQEVGARYAAGDVAALLALGLLARSSRSDNFVRATDAGVELLNTGYCRSEVA
ncbi:hypothetical protein [Vulcaniibacterium tengchongense]|uniref:ArsR family transcriptional regulator n=1 Tax=Vulcaniibacterium tengchongense TaxID=1273429 RepID=A0A3N4V0H8_9GAMM|nr:hypothetical protein [Vulcaniibacterium tengchongense]RPE74645.1 hypothetical protein EDC50_3174 [Vulcaniibacterium tengchongense]